MANTTTDLYLKKLRQKYKEKGATEQEANTMASQQQSQQEAQQTQNKELNGWQKFGAGVEEFVDNMAQTFLDLGEGLVDAHAIALGSIAEWTGNKELAKNTRQFVERDWTDELVNQGNAFGTGVDLWRYANFPSELVFGKEARDLSRKEDLLPDVVDSISSGIGSSLGMGALSSIPYVGWALTGMAAGGASAEQTLRENPDIDISSAMGYGIINGSVEVASELLVGKVLGLLGKGINKAVGGSAVSETATRFGLGSSTGGNILTNLIKEFNEEGVEEVVSELVDPIARKLTIEKDKDWNDVVGENWGNAEYWINDVWTAYWQGGLSSVVMGGTGAAVNAVKVGGVRNYNAVLQVRQVAEINEQIKELEKNNTGGRYNARIEALNTQKQNVINNFQKNFEEFARDYLSQQNGEVLDKKQQRKADIYESLQQEQNRNVRQELATESAMKSGAFEVQFSEDGRPSYAVKKNNFINYKGEKLNTKDWLKTVIHEIGHINANDVEFVNSVLQDVSAEDLQNAENEYNKRYGKTYNDANVRKTDLFKEYIKQGLKYKEAISKARQQMIREEIAMDRLASMFNNQAEFNRAINGEKMSLIERLKDKFINTYKHVEEVQKPKNYNQIIKYLQEAVKQTKERRNDLYNKENTSTEDRRYEIEDIDELFDDLTDEELDEISKSVDKWIEEYEAKHPIESKGKNKEEKFDGYSDEALKDINDSLPKQVKDYFKDSVVKSNSVDWFDGKKDSKYLIPMFHGTPNKGMFFFDSSRIGTNGTVRGFGFYLTNDYSDANETYAGENGKVITAFVNITKPMSETKTTISRYQVEEFIRKYVDKTGDGLLGGYGVDAYKNYDMAVEAALDNIMNNNKTDVDIINEMYVNSGINYDTFFNAVTEHFGFDGIVYKNRSEGTIVIAFRSNQIKDITNKNPTSNRDIRYENESTGTPLDPRTKSYYIKQATSLLRTVDDSKVDTVNNIIKQMNEATTVEEITKLNKEIENIKKENVQENVNQRATETNGTGTTRDTSEVSKGSTGSNVGERRETESKTERNVDSTTFGNDATHIQMEQDSRDNRVRPSGRQRDTLYDAKNRYDSELRNVSNRGRGRDRLTNLYQFGTLIRDNKNIATKPKTMDGSTYDVIFDDYLPQYLQDMKTELQKIKVGENDLQVYFYVSDITDTRNGFATDDTIMVRLDSTTQNNAIHELSHILSKLSSKAYYKVSFDIQNYLITSPQEKNDLLKSFNNTYKTKYTKSFSNFLYNEDYAKLNKEQQKKVDNDVKNLVFEEMCCAIVQGKTKLKDRQLHNKIIADYLANIKNEYGIDLTPYYYSDFIDYDEVRVKPEELKLSTYMPIEIVEPNEANKKQGLQLFSDYVEAVNGLVDKFKKNFDRLEVSTDFEKILPAYDKILSYKQNISRDIKNLDNYSTEWQSIYADEFKPLKQRLEEVKNSFAEYTKKFAAKKDEPSLLQRLTTKVKDLEIQDKYQKEKAELLKSLARNRFAGHQDFLEQAQNIAEWIEVKYSEAIENAKNGYDSLYYQYFQKQIDALWSDFEKENEKTYTNIQQGNLSQLVEEANAKKIKKKLKRGDATYSKADEAKRLKELKEQVKPDLQKVKNVQYQYTKLIKKQKSIYINYNLDTHNDGAQSPLGKTAKLSLYERVVSYINDLTTAIKDYKQAVADLTKNEVFRTAAFTKELFETINTLERSIGSTLDEDAFKTLYGLKNTLYEDVVKATKEAEQKYADKLSKQDAETKKEIKNAMKDIERNIPNQANDYLDIIEEQVDKYTELKMKYEGQTELLNEAEKAIKDLKAKLKKAKAQTPKSLEQMKKRVDIWKRKFVDERVSKKELLDEVKKYKKEVLENKAEDKVNLSAEAKASVDNYNRLEQQLKEQIELNKKVGAELKKKKAEYTEKVSEAKTLTNKVASLRKKLVLEKINGKSMIKVDGNFYAFVNELLGKEISDSLTDNDMQRLGVAFSTGDFESFSSTLTEALQAKGYDTMLMALELGDSLYYEDNFIDLFEAAFLELNNYQNNEFTNVGKLMVRLANAKTDYKLLQEAYRADMTIRQAQVRAKSFTKFFAENTKNNSSRLNGVDPKFRDNLVKFVKEVREFDNLDSISNGELRTKIIDFLKTLKTEYNGKIEVNGIALDSGIVNMLDTLENIQQQSKEYAEDLQATAEEFEEKPKNKEKISKYEAKLYKDFFSGMKKFTDEVMHNRYWEIGNLTIKGTDFTQTLVNQIYKYKNAIKQLKWNPISKMYISPRNIFRELSAYDNDAYVMQLFNELEKGTIRTMQAKMDLAKPLKEFFDKNKKFVKELEVDSKKYEHTIEYGDGESFTASTTLLLDFYEAIQNENNKQHILNDGVEFGNVDPIKISEEELNDIEQAIRKEFNLDNKNSVYAQYIDLLNTMYDKAKQLKVETDIRMRGFSNIQEGFYYPTSVSDFNLDIDLSQSAYNMGNTYGGADLVTTERSFNKDLKSTRGAVRITNSYQKMLNHINGMASYYGVDTAILNFSKMYRYRVEGGISSGNAIRQLYGTDYKKFDRYLGELFKDMRGTNNPMTGTDATINSIEKLLRSGVVTATLVNPKVIATQPASLLTAMKYISPKHILSSLKEGFVLTSKYPPLPTSGAIRYFDQSALQAETGGIDNKFQKTLGKGISAGDHFAINIEWAACCKQVGLLEFEKGTTEYNEALKKAEELFNRVVFDTQPNNNALGKAEIMRSDNEIVKLLTMYRSQAMQNFNIAYDAINQLKTIHKLIKAQNITGEKKRLMLAGPRKDLARALASLILEGMLFTFIGQLFAHFVNNDWDDEDFWANATKDFGVAYFNDNVLGILPVLNKLQVEIEDNLSVSANNITMGWLENIVDSIKNLISKPNPKQFVQLFSYGTGIPLATNYKYTKAIVQYISPEFAYQFDALYNGVDTSTKSAINYALNDKQYSKAYELYKTYNSRSIDFETRTLQEMFNLYKKGYTDVSVKGIPDNISYNGETIKIDKKKFKDIYSRVAKKINPLIRSGAYNKLTDEKKSLVIKYLLNTYYNIAKKSFTGQDMSFIEKIFYADYNLSPNLLLQIYDIQNIASDEKETRKAKIEAYIRKSSNYQAEKYFLQMTSGYSLNDEYKNFVIGYLTNKGLGWKKAKEIVWS